MKLTVFGQPLRKSDRLIVALLLINAFIIGALLGTAFYEDIMKRREIIETESGKSLVYADDGFVIYGRLFKGDGQGGLIGGGANDFDIPRAYTNEEFLDALCLPTNVFRTYIENKNYQQHTA